jgi:hypothetical protein
MPAGGFLEHTLLRLLERRYVIALALALAAIWGGRRWGGDALGGVDLMLHPPGEVKSPLAADIIKTSEAGESAKLRGLHRVVSADTMTPSPKPSAAISSNSNAQANRIAGRGRLRPEVWQVRDLR